MAVVRVVLDLLAPRRCLACGRRGDPPWCPACGREVASLAPACPRCSAARPTGAGPCPLDGSHVSRVIAPYRYSGVVAAVVRGAKLDGCPDAYRPLGHDLARAVVHHDVSGIDVVTGIPVPARRRRRRGFDHAALLAATVGNDLDLPVDVLLDVVGAAGDRGAGGASVAVAEMTARGSRPGHVLVVDDVVTTGATVRVAAAALVAAGADLVTVAAVARAGGHDDPRG